ncbi:hypothetical protein BCR35DRAFT_301431 [Leucosporidium creatinivorum]|uniref:Uncharacterized protein n=1 Tax=Leucosporidium creatinivorum TaxID=106004 RepID=A0A1Y2FX71_9BASI|nr:hypothetical protein BCR35DRAFT_301431 [Leucosporidium creatinivorum]
MLCTSERTPNPRLASLRLPRRRLRRGLTRARPPPQAKSGTGEGASERVTPTASG